MKNLWDIEKKYYQSGKKTICGVDEAGRGPLAGPVCAAAVILPPGFCIDRLDDSKKLSASIREKLYEEITASAISFGIAFSSVDEIEELNILNATYLAMNRAISMLKPVPELSLIDGNRNSGIAYPSECIIKGDSCCADIAAASILAKVTRDRYMCELADKFPQYGFEKHKGYGTAAHYSAIKEYGPCPAHRKSFLRNMH